MYTTACNFEELRKHMKSMQNIFVHWFTVNDLRTNIDEIVIKKERY